MNGIEHITVGRTLMAFTTLTSTNEFASTLLAKTRPSHGTVIVADFQTHGKGQYGRKWFGSKGKNIYASVILFPKLSSEHTFALNAAFAIAMRETVTKHLGASRVHVDIKWPNDIYCQGSKIGGILVENTFSGKVLRSCVVGLGLNVNEANFMADIPNPVAMSTITGSRHNRWQILNDLLESFSHWYDRALKSPPEMVMTHYSKYLFGLNMEQRFTLADNSRIIEGSIRYVDSNGRLAVDTRQGLLLFRHGEIKQLTDEVQDY